MRRSYILILLLVAVLVVGGVFYLEYHHRQELSKVQNACIILISKQEMKLRLIDYKGQEIFCAPVATGKNVGDKRKQGDMRTPEGVFQVSDIQQATDWKHEPLLYPKKGSTLFSTFTLDIVPSLPTMNRTPTLPCVPFSWQAFGYSRF